MKRFEQIIRILAILIFLAVMPAWAQDGTPADMLYQDNTLVLTINGETSELKYDLFGFDAEKRIRDLFSYTNIPEDVIPDYSIDVSSLESVLSEYTEVLPEEVKDIFNELPYAAEDAKNEFGKLFSGLKEEFSNKMEELQVDEFLQEAEEKVNSVSQQIIYQMSGKTVAFTAEEGPCRLAVIAFPEEHETGKTYTASPGSDQEQLGLLIDQTIFYTQIEKAAVQKIQGLMPIPVPDSAVTSRTGFTDEDDHYSLTIEEETEEMLQGHFEGRFYSGETVISGTFRIVYPKWPSPKYDGIE